MLGYYLGVGVEQCPLCGGELIRPNGSRVLKLGGGEVFPHEPASSAQPFPRRSARLRPHPSKPCAVPERLLSPRNLRQIPFGARTRFKAHARHLGAHLRASNKWVVIVWAHLGRGRIRVHLTQRENTLGHFGLNLVTVSSLRCGAQRCISFTPYFTFDHRILKYR